MSSCCTCFFLFLVFFRHTKRGQSRSPHVPLCRMFSGHHPAGHVSVRLIVRLNLGSHVHIVRPPCLSFLYLIFMCVARVFVPGASSEVVDLVQLSPLLSPSAALFLFRCCTCLPCARMCMCVSVSFFFVLSLSLYRFNPLRCFVFSFSASRVCVSQERLVEFSTCLEDEALYGLMSSLQALAVVDLANTSTVLPQERSIARERE